LRLSTSTTSRQSVFTVISDGSADALSDDSSQANTPDGSECHWYEVVQGESLEQGDLLFDLVTPRVSIEAAGDGGYGILTGRGEYVVLSQTCDLEHNKVREVLLASLRTYQDLAHEMQAARGRNFREALINGADFAYFLLHRFDGPPFLDWSVVNFHQLRLLDTQFCRSQARDLGSRLRLVAPYKENLAQAFGRFMMRTALPETAHAFKNVTYAAPPVQRVGGKGSS
jgi:hypothetical protein